jgi:hypothetical protein
MVQKLKIGRLPKLYDLSIHSMKISSLIQKLINYLENSLLNTFK